MSFASYSLDYLTNDIVSGFVLCHVAFINSDIRCHSRLNDSLSFASACTSVEDAVPANRPPAATDLFVHAHLGLVIYDHLLTLPSEVELFWKWEFSGAAALFFTNRYLVLWELGIFRFFPQGITVSVTSASCVPPDAESSGPDMVRLAPLA